MPCPDLRSLACAMLLGFRVATAQPASSVSYTVRVDSIGATGISVDMRVRQAPAEFRLAMVAHTEYDDEYWRYVHDLRGESAAGPVRIAREDSALWRVTRRRAGDVSIRYRVTFPTAPPGQQEAWKAHLTPTGGLAGGPHSFLYVVGAEHAPVTVKVEAPKAWSIATGLDSIGPRTYAAAGIGQLVDSPMLLGPLRRWSFRIAGVEHHLDYLGHPGGVAFDTTTFLDGVERLARETHRLFGAMPYRRYEFLFEDGAGGGLEHVNSVTIGTNSANLRRDPNSLLGQVAHEFFHTWNEVHLRPQAWIGVRYVAPEPTGELWWSEGVTIYYADLLLRRAGLPVADSSRLAHLERLFASYLYNPSHAAVAPEATSRAFNKSPVVTGDFTPGMFVQGEVLGTVLDLMIRSESGGRRSLDDAMRAMTRHFSIERGFTGADVERSVSDACGCDAGPFFERFVRTAHPVDLESALDRAGARMTVTWAPAVTAAGAPLADTRLYPISGPRGTVLLKIWAPVTVWARAGLHTGDRVESIDGRAVINAQDFRAATNRLAVGDLARLVVWRDSTRLEKVVVVEGYERPTVRIQLRPDATAAERALFTAWAAGR